MNRRNLIKIASAFAFATALTKTPGRAQILVNAATGGEGSPFSEEWLLTVAQNLARREFSLPQLNLPDQLRDLSREQYQAIQYKNDASVWKDDGLAHQLQFFHTGFLYKVPVEIHLIDKGIARPFTYRPSQFDFNLPAFAPPADSQSGFSGLRALAPIHSANLTQEYLAFQGASYFRALASGQVYGVLARGLSVNTAQAAGEEFPVFRAFWIQKPAPGEQHLLIYALLDGPSVTGAYKFLALPAQPMVMDVECTLFPRVALSHVGIAPLTSMYFYGAADPTRMDDYRPAIHNSDSLSMWNGAGDWLLRPLTNPDRLQYSAFSDRNPKGFGLLQRQRAFHAYQDIDARFGDRPSVWVEPQGDWGDGSIDLIELPSQSQIYDNIVAFWRPKAPLSERASHRFRYKLHWGWKSPVRTTKARVAQTLVGGIGEENRQFVIDFVSDGSCENCNVQQLTADIRTPEGEINNIRIQENKAIGGPRVSFMFHSRGADQTDLRCELKQDGRAVSEIWVYRWTES